MDKENLLIENLKEFNLNLTDFKRNVIFVNDVFLQKLEEFEEDGPPYKDITENDFYKSSIYKVEELKDKIEKGLTNFTFDSAFDLYKEFTCLLQIAEEDLVFINSMLNQEIDKKSCNYCLSELEIIKNEINLILENLDEIIAKLKNLK